MLAVSADVEREQRVHLGERGRQGRARLIQLGNSEDCLQARVDLVNLRVRFQQLGAHGFVERDDVGLQFQRVQPFVKFAGGLEVGRQQPRQFRRAGRLTGLDEFPDEQQQDFRLLGERFGQVEPKRLGGFPVAFGQQGAELLMIILG